MRNRSGSDMEKRSLIISRELRHLGGREQAAGLHERGSLGEFVIFMPASALPLSVSTLGGRNR
jgi:hypothetical protein